MRRKTVCHIQRFPDLDIEAKSAITSFLVV